MKRLNHNSRAAYESSSASHRLKDPIILKSKHVPAGYCNVKEDFSLILHGEALINLKLDKVQDIENIHLQELFDIAEIRIDNIYKTTINYTTYKGSLELAA